MNEKVDNLDFELTPLEEHVDFEDQGKYTKLSTSEAQRLQMGALIQNIPGLIATGTLAQAYVVRFPEGLPHTLLSLKQGGYGSPILGSDGKFVGSASFFPTDVQAVMMGAFTTMSILSGQYFLSKINSELSLIKMTLDKILEFLYGDKKAELLAEASFIKYAFYNYSSIMQCSEQRIATLQNIQEAKKVAMKDIEFYMMDLDSLAHPADGFKVAYVTERAFQIKESLDFSIQLYGFACVLEAYYAQNYDPTFLQYVDKELSSYIVKCEKRILGAFSLINGQIINYKGNLFEKVEKEPYEKRVKDLIESMHMEEDSSLYTTIHNAIQSLTKPKTYYIKNNGDIYVKSAAV